MAEIHIESLTNSYEEIFLDHEIYIGAALSGRYAAKVSSLMPGLMPGLNFQLMMP